MLPEALAELRNVCPGAAEMKEGGTEFAFLPALTIPVGTDTVQRDALLSLGPHSGYDSRLYLSSPIPGKGTNWTQHTVLGRAWHTPSWNSVKTARPIEMLSQHFGTYK